MKLDPTALAILTEACAESPTVKREGLWGVLWDYLEERGCEEACQALEWAARQERYPTHAVVTSGKRDKWGWSRYPVENPTGDWERHWRLPRGGERWQSWDLDSIPQAWQWLLEGGPQAGSLEEGGP